jgi:uncharacterized protein (DUF885 family)
VPRKSLDTLESLPKELSSQVATPLLLIPSEDFDLYFRFEVTVSRRLRALGLCALSAGVMFLSAPDRSRATPSDSLKAGVAGLIADRGKAPEGKRLHRLFQLHSEYLIHEFPEYATYVGARGQNGRWTDRSAAAIARRKTDLEWPAKALATIDRRKLSPGDRLNYDLFRRQVEEHLEGRRFLWELMPVSQLGGIHLDVPAMLSQQMPARTEADYEDILRRLRGTPTLVEQTIGLMKEGLRRGITPPKITLRAVPAQAAAILVEDAAESPFLGAFHAMPGTIPADKRAALQADAARLLTEQVLPAFRSLREFLATEYIPNCRESLAATGLPDGPAWYAYLVRLATTTRLPPKEIHDIGLAEVKQIRAEMERVMRATGFDKDLPAFFEFLQTDPRFFFSRPEDLLAGYRDIAKRADPEVIKLFRTLPRLPYGVVPAPAYAAASRSAGYYDGGSLEAGRPGYFLANLSAVNTRPKWEMEALVLHEAVPGHHLQIALVQERSDLPEFRKHGSYEAYVEGWGLYAETLGHEMGFYTDPYSHFGALNFRMWRAVRLVVDTGIHAFGWSRQDAIDFFRANSAKSQGEIAVEVDRYIARPGQALAYTIGLRKFLELRELARRELGPTFDLRAFHDAVLADGALPLDVLEARTDQWIARHKAPGSQPR